MVFIEWVIWAVTCVTLLSFILAALSAFDPELRSYLWRQCLLLSFGLIITSLTTISKLHLLWWVPSTFILNIILFMIITSFRLGVNMRNFEKQIETEQRIVAESKTLRG